MVPDGKKENLKNAWNRKNYTTTHGILNSLSYHLPFPEPKRTAIERGGRRHMCLYTRFSSTLKSGVVQQQSSPRLLQDDNDTLVPIKSLALGLNPCPTL